jgi:hypothetical protein
MNDGGKSDGPVLPAKPPNNPAVVAGAEVVEGKAPDNRHEKGNERVLHRKTKQVTMAPSHASATREGAAKR